MIWDRIFTIGSFIGLCVFVYVVMKFVTEPNLWIVFAICLSVAAYFGWREIRAGGSHEEETPHDQTDDKPS